MTPYCRFVLTLTWLMVSPLGAQIPAPQEPPPITIPQMAQDPPPISLLQAAQQPPWGHLETYTVQLQVPPHLLKLMTLPSRLTVWVFPNYQLADVETLFTNAGLSQETIDELLDMDRWIQDPEGIRVFPPSKFIGKMDPNARSIIYQTLGRFPQNRFHYQPFVIQPDYLRSLIVEDEQFDEHVFTIIERLSYKRGKFQLFSDLPYLLEFITGTEKQMALLRALTTTPSLVLQLRFPEGMDKTLMQSYWTADGRNFDAWPLLESLTRENSIEVLDVANLLPPTPRRYLNTFPSAEDGLEGRYPDAFWSSINFFNFVPTNIYFDHSDSDSYLKKHFQQAPAPLRFGDMLLLVRGSDRKVLHACVYIADNIVYTKNGSALFQPWVFMKLEDMLAYHEPGQNMTLVNWRRLPKQRPMQTSPYVPRTPIIPTR